MRALTVRQPWASLIVAGIKPVENRTWPVPRTLLQWVRCDRCGRRSRDGTPERGPGNGIHYTDACAPEWGLVGNLIADDPFPFRLAIHAGASIDAAAWRSQAVREAMPRRSSLCGYRHWYSEPGAVGSRSDVCTRCGYVPPPTGVLLGTVLVTGCHHADECADFDSVTLGGCVDIDGGWWHKPTEDRPCHTARYCSRWAEPNVWHWTLADPQPLDEPIPMRGRQGLWTVPDDALAKVPA